MLEQDLKSLLESTREECFVYANYKRLSKLVKACDPAVLPEDKAYFDQLHAKIMAAIDGEPPPIQES